MRKHYYKVHGDINETVMLKGDNLLYVGMAHKLGILNPSQSVDTPVYINQRNWKCFPGFQLENAYKNHVKLVEGLPS
jgi:hypothetical protein